MALVTAAGAAALAHGAILPAVLLPAAFLLYAVSWRSLLRALRATLPLALFALIVLAIQWLWGRFDPILPARALGVFWFAAAAFRLAPWSRLADAVRPGSRLCAPVLLLLFTRHFSFILTGEARRVLCSRRRAVARPYGGWAFRSLTAALASLFLRALMRAERFYGALLLKGLAE